MRRLTRSDLAVPLVLLAVTLLAYLPALRAGFIWDDDFYVTANETLADLGGLGEDLARFGCEPAVLPPTFTTFWIERRIFGLEPAGYHLLNVLLHATSSILLYRILTLLEVPGAVLGAALFAVHPLEVESVAWVTERKNVLSGVFFLAAALSYLRFSLKGSGSRRLPAAALGLFACALLSKSVTALLPVALCIVVAWKKGRPGKRDLLPLLVMLVLGAAAGLLTAHLERAQVGASGEEWSMTLVERALLAGRIFWFYLGKLVLPVRLAFVYPRFDVRGDAMLAWLFPLSALGLVVALWALRSRLGSGPAVAVVLYAVLLFPVLGFLNVFPMRYSFVADHFQYLAGLAPLALLAAAAAAAFRRIGAARLAAYGTGSILVAALAGASFAHARVFHDPETLWRDTVSKYPRAFMAQYNLACLLDEQGKRDEAVAHLLQAIEANPGYTDALNNLGAIRLDEGRVDEAASYFERIVAASPQHLTARYNLALALDRGGRTDRAIAQLEEVIRATPDAGSMANEMTALLYRRGWLGVPLEQSHATIASLLARAGRTEEAAAHYRRAAEIRPDLPGPWMSLGRLYQDRGDLVRAVSCFEQALAIDPANAVARSLLARAREAAGPTSPSRTP